MDDHKTKRQGIESFDAVLRDAVIADSSPQADSSVLANFEKRVEDIAEVAETVVQSPAAESAEDQPPPERQDEQDAPDPLDEGREQEYFAPHSLEEQDGQEYDRQTMGKKTFIDRIKDLLGGAGKREPTKREEEEVDEVPVLFDEYLNVAQNGREDMAGGRENEYPSESAFEAQPEMIVKVQLEQEIQADTFEEALPETAPGPEIQNELVTEDQPEPKTDSDARSEFPLPDTREMRAEQTPDSPAYDEPVLWEEPWEQEPVTEKDEAPESRKEKSRGFKGMFDLFGQGKKEAKPVSSLGRGDAPPILADDRQPPQSWNTSYKEEGSLMDRKVVQPDYSIPASQPEPRGKLPDRTVLDKSVAINGDLAIESPIEFYGQIKGNIACKSGVFMGMHASAEGNISANKITIEGGIVKGDLHCEELVTISSSSVIEGNINANSAEIDAQVTGNISAADSLFIGASSIITGDITSSKLTVEPGAVINGRCSVRA